MTEDPTAVTRVVGRGDSAVRVVQAWTIEVVTGLQAGHTAPIERPVFRIGSHPSNDLVLRDDTVSKHHLELTATASGYRLVDLASANGTFVGASRIGDMTVVAAVTLRLGACTLRLVPSAVEVEVPATTEASFGALLGRSLVMRELFAQLRNVAKSDSAVLLEGEPGVGKELAADSLHRASERKSGPFVVVDCAALAGSLVDSELFGHVRGAFTGAISDRSGLLRQAHRGTVFFDEVSELPAAVQAKLLGVLERRKVTPIGSSKTLPLDVRVIAATRNDLGRLVNERRFRADLFFRLAVIRVRVPPLRDRLEDLPVLIESFLADLQAREGPWVPSSLSALAIATLAQQPWPGNVRELRNAVERIALQLPAEPRTARVDEPFLAARNRARAEFERSYFAELLRRANGNISQVARMAQLDRGYLSRILRRLQLSATKPGR